MDKNRPLLAVLQSQIRLCCRDIGYESATFLAATLTWLLKENVLDLKISDEFNNRPNKQEISPCSQGIERRLVELEKIIKTQQNQLDNLRAEKNAEIDNLRERIKNLEANEQMKTKNQVPIDTQKVNGNGVNDVDNCRERRSELSEKPAFYVYLSGSRCYNHHEPFKFDKKETNIGLHYNSIDGIFETTVTGTYVFTVTVGSEAESFVTAEIVVNGDVKGTAFSNSYNINDQHSASSTIVVEVETGDHVFVRRGTANKDCSIYSAATQTWTSFSGWLLF